MLTIEKCRKYLQGKELSDERVLEIRDYLQSLSREIIRSHVEAYEKNLRKVLKNE